MFVRTCALWQVDKLRENILGKGNFWQLIPDRWMHYNTPNGPDPHWEKVAPDSSHDMLIYNKKNLSETVTESSGGQPPKRLCILSPKTCAGDGPCCRQLTCINSHITCECHKKTKQRGSVGRRGSRGTCNTGPWTDRKNWICISSFQCPKRQWSSRREAWWPSCVPPLVGAGCRFQWVQQGMLHEQFSIFSLISFMQHPMALKVEDKGEEKWKGHILSSILHDFHLSDIPSY